MPTGYSNILLVEIEGRKLRGHLADALVAGQIDFGAGVPGAFQLTFRDHGRTLLGEAGIRLGTKVVLSPESDGKGASSPLLTGEVTGLEGDYDSTGSFAVVRGYDLGHRMLRQRRTQAYRNMTASDIARTLAGKDRVPIGMIQSTKTVYDFITQSGVTDWDFLCRLADENDMVLSLNPRGRLQFAKLDPASGAPAAGAPGPNRNPLVLSRPDVHRARASITSAGQVSRVEARGWDVTTKKELVSQAPADDNPGIDIGATPAEAVEAFGAAKLVETDIPYDRASEVRSAANSLAADVTASFAELEVTVSGNPRLRPGVPVTLARIGKPFEGKYTVIGARHEFAAARPYRVTLTVSGRQWRSLYGLASGGAPAAPRLPSVANAVVTDIKDPLRQGRVKLRFPWLDDKYVSDWTRSVQFGGVGGGGLIAPDVGDEVLVAFDRGALDHPFVIGGLYNGRDEPGKSDVRPYDGTSGKTVRRTLADRSGNRLDLLDQRLGTKRGVRLKTGDDRLTIELDRTKTEISVDSKGSVSIKGARSVSVEAGEDLSLKAGGRLSITSEGILSINGRGGVEVGGTEVSVKADAARMMNSTGMATLTGEESLFLSSPVNLLLVSASVKANGMPVV